MKPVAQFLAVMAVAAAVLTTLSFFQRVQGALNPCGLTGRCMDSYAASYFDGLVPYDEVLASSADPPPYVIIPLTASRACSYAVVRLNDKAPEKPPAPRLDSRGLSYRWAYLRQAKGALAQSGKGRLEEAFYACAPMWGRGAASPVLAAMSDADTYFANGLTSGLFYLYSVRHRVAMRLRYAR